MTSKQPSQTAAQPLNLSGLVATARPANLVGRRATAPKTTHTLDLVKTCEPQLLGPMPVTMVPQLKADIRHSADALNYGVKVQVQTLDGTKIPEADVKELLNLVEHDPSKQVQVNMAFIGSTERKIIHRRTAEEKARDEAAAATQ